MVIKNLSKGFLKTHSQLNPKIFVKEKNTKRYIYKLY